MLYGGASVICRIMNSAPVAPNLNLMFSIARPARAAPATHTHHSRNLADSYIVAYIYIYNTVCVNVCVYM